ncbi:MULTISPECIES: hypothetical protein [Pseudomonas]|uniref:hypothetical protein n=1 Tax=Pseudomonas TaxID=286 RepID=UPI000D104138|nr:MULTISPECIES: hypothetical protein [Pseudomonas]AVO61040.1 hypothetical protein C6Q18_24815 [Pseudomonas chlororaphis subsp. piscium]
MRVFYYFRVAVVGFEALVLLLGMVVWKFWFLEFKAVFDLMSLDGEAFKYLMLIPAGLAVWVFNEIKLLLQEDKEVARLIVEWPDYWRFKCHAWVSLFYAIVFSVFSIIPWLLKTRSESAEAFLLFLVAMAGQLCLSLSVYLARIRFKEIVVFFKTS